MYSAAQPGQRALTLDHPVLACTTTSWTDWCLCKLIGKGSQSLPSGRLGAQAEQQLVGAGLGQHAPALLAAGLPSILLRRVIVPSNGASRENGETLPIGQSKVGGLPDTPPRFRWPVVPGDSPQSFAGKPLAFVAQVNLSEVAP